MRLWWRFSTHHFENQWLRPLASPSLFQLMIVFFSIYSIYWDIFILHAANTTFLPSFSLHCRLSGAKPASDSNTKHTKPFQFNAMQHRQQVPLDLYFLVSSGKIRLYKGWIWLICVFFQPHLLCNYVTIQVSKCNYCVQPSGPGHPRRNFAATQTVCVSRCIAAGCISQTIYITNLPCCFLDYNCTTVHLSKGALSCH